MSETMKLYEIVDQIQELGTILAEHEGELTDDLEARWDEIAGSLDEKVENTALFVRDLQASAEAVKAEEKRLKRRRRALENKAARLKDYLHHQVARGGVRKIETDRVVVRIQRNSRPSIRWMGEEDAIPEAFRRVKINADTQAVYQQIKSGGELPDGFAVEWGDHLRIQ